MGLLPNRCEQFRAAQRFDAIYEYLEIAMKLRPHHPGNRFMDSSIRFPTLCSHPEAVRDRAFMKTKKPALGGAGFLGCSGLRRIILQLR